jgi:hypothetical protein
MMEQGVVTTVKYEKGVPVCNVQDQNRPTAEEYKNVPVMRMFKGMFIVPEQEQKVQMLKMGEARFIVGILDRGKGDITPPSLSEGEFSIKVDDGTEITITENGNGDHDVDISASGQVTIDGTPFSDHVHKYEDETIEDTGDGTGTSSSQTRTTNTPTT